MMLDVLPGDRQLDPPARLRRPPARIIAFGVAIAGLIGHGFLSGARVDPATLIAGIGNMVDFLGEAFPPDLGRLDRVGESMLETIEIAVIGTALGALIALPLSILAARNLAPNRWVYGMSRAFIAFLRAIPDLVWGLLFVITVGLGPEAGVLAIAADVAGLCGRFFADRLEDVPDPLVESLRATGATGTGIVLGGIVPSVAPSFVGITLYGLENATRSSVVLGVVGAGGIGIELTTAIELLRYDEAATVIIAIFAVVIVVERLAAMVRRHLGVGAGLAP